MMLSPIGKQPDLHRQPRNRWSLGRRGRIAIVLLLWLSATGCSNIVKFAVDKTQPQGEKIRGITYYLGGAGPVGNIGSFDIPRGLRRAGYQGHFEVFPWQTISHATDQIFIARNRSKAQDLAEDIRRYRRLYPDAPIHIIALSAGTGVATFALEYLPESIDIETVIFLGCSMSSKYDMTRALRRIRGRLYVLHSTADEVLKNVVWYTGTVDRASSDAGIAGLEGFYTPGNLFPDTERQYLKLINVPYRSEFESSGYGGGHTSATSTDFVQRYLAPAVMGDPTPLLGRSQYQAPQAPARREPPADNRTDEPIPPPWPTLPNQQTTATDDDANADSVNGDPQGATGAKQPTTDADDPLRPPPTEPTGGNIRANPEPAEPEPDAPPTTEGDPADPNPPVADPDSESAG